MARRTRRSRVGSLPKCWPFEVVPLSRYRVLSSAVEKSSERAPRVSSALRVCGSSVALSESQASYSRRLRLFWRRGGP